MKTNFYILLSLKTPSGFENYGQYFIGDDSEAAYALFEQFKGNRMITEPALLYLDLMETVEDIPVKIKTICCTLEELGCNCKLIAKEIFRQMNLKEW